MGWFCVGLQSGCAGFDKQMQSAMAGHYISLQINVVKGSSFYGVCECDFKKTLPAFVGSNPSPASIKNNPDLFASDFVFT